MESKAETFRTWPTERLQEEIVLITGIIENSDDNYEGVIQKRYKTILESEINRRASLRRVTDKERVQMEIRQIAQWGSNK